MQSHRASFIEISPCTRLGRVIKGGLGTKIHATCDALGNPLEFYLSPGQTHDLQGADALLPEIKAEAVIADKAYDADERVRHKLAEKGCVAVIPSKSNRIHAVEYDTELYKARHLIENFFAKLKQYRAIATRYDKTAQNFLGAIYVAAIVIFSGHDLDFIVSAATEIIFLDNRSATLMSTDRFLSSQR